MKEDKKVKVDLSFFFFFFVSQTRDKRERFPFLRIAFQRLAELCSVAKFCCWTRSLENKKLRHFRWKFEKLKLKEEGNSEGESFVFSLPGEIVSFRSFDPLSDWIEMIRDAS